MNHMFKIATMTLGLGGAGVSSALSAPASGPSSSAASVIEQAQLFWNGEEYCFYRDGWRGPGWYICGYAWRRGYGWGGGSGWHERHYRDHDRRGYREGAPAYRERDHRDMDHRDMDRRRDPGHPDMRGGEGGRR